MKWFNRIDDKFDFVVVVIIVVILVVAAFIVAK